jgi:hypothetical protein
VSRISYSDEEDFAGQFELWQANCQRSLSGKRGQAALLELEAALLALPSKRLIANDLEDEEGEVCAIGALARHKNIKPQHDPDGEMAEIGEECGMPRPVAWKVVEMNDLQFDYRWSESGMTPYTAEERYAAMLAWVQKQLTRERGADKEGRG